MEQQNIVFNVHSYCFYRIVSFLASVSKYSHKPIRPWAELQEKCEGELTVTSQFLEFCPCMGRGAEVKQK